MAEVKPRLKVRTEKCAGGAVENRAARAKRLERKLTLRKAKVPSPPEAAQRDARCYEQTDDTKNHRRRLDRLIVPFTRISITRFPPVLVAFANVAAVIDREAIFAPEGHLIRAIENAVVAFA